MTRGMGGSSPSNIAHHLKGIDFPASREQLLECARKNNADQDVQQTIEQMPDTRYGDMAEVMKGYGEVH
nr:DUF2795 domain-containing protein [uncultured Pseudomonas sp.]